MPKMLTMKLLCICGLLATLQNVVVAMNNPYQVGTAPPVDNESGSEEDNNDQVPPQHAGGFSSGTHQQPNMMMHGGVPMHPSQQWPQQSSPSASFSSNNAANQPYGSQQHPGMNMPSATGSFNSNPQFYANAQQGGFAGGMPQNQGMNMPFNMMSPEQMNQFQQFMMMQQQQMQQQQMNPQQQQQQIPGGSKRLASLTSSNQGSMSMSGNYPQFNPQFNPNLMSMPSMSMMPGGSQQFQQIPSKKTGRVASSRGSKPSPKNVYAPSKPLFLSYYSMNERVTYPISSKQYNYLLMPYVLEASVCMDLERKRLSFNDLKKKETDKLLVDKAKVNIDYKKLEDKISNITVEANDQWATHLHYLRTDWIKKAETKANSPYLKQLITTSALNRSALLYMSLHNATFGQPNTDVDDLNEIMVTLSNDERDKVVEVYKNEYRTSANDDLCSTLIKKESKLSGTYYGTFIDGLCKNKRDEKFDIKKYLNEQSNKREYYTHGLAKEEAEILKEFIGKSNNPKEFKEFWATKRQSDSIKEKKQVILDLFTKHNYEKMRYIFSLYQGNVWEDLDKAMIPIKTTFTGKMLNDKNMESLKNMMSLVRFILIDVIHGRPRLLALLLRDKLNRIYLAHLNDKNKEELQDAFNDATRIFLLRGPVDLVDIGDEYAEGHKLYQKKVDVTTMQGQKIKNLVAAKDENFNELVNHLDVIDETFAKSQAQKKTDYQNEQNAITGYKQLLKWLRDPINEVESDDDEEQNEEKDESTNLVLIQAEAKTAFGTDKNPPIIWVQPADNEVQHGKEESRVVVTGDGKVSTQKDVGQQFYAGNPAGPYGNPAFAPQGFPMQQMQPGNQFQQQYGSFSQQQPQHYGNMPMYNPQQNYNPNQQQMNQQYSQEDMHNQMRNMSFGSQQ